MIFTNQPACCIFFDLSSLESAQLAVFLNDFLSRQKKILVQGSFHWLIHAQHFSQFLSRSIQAKDFFHERLSHGDIIFAVNTSGQDWNHLFPCEASKDIEETIKATGINVPLFLKETLIRPFWIEQIQHSLLLIERFSDHWDLIFVHNGKAKMLSWAKNDPRVCWITPDNALTESFSFTPGKSLSDCSKSLQQATSLLTSSFTPAQKLKLYHSAQMRQKASDYLSLQKIFRKNNEFPGLGDKEAVSSKETLGGIRQRVLISNMSGISDLKEANLLIQFQGGHLFQIDRADLKKPLCVQADSYIEWKGRKRFFSTTSAFNFDGDFSFGLRECLILQDKDLTEPARMIIDYFFVEESTEFFVSVSVRWPCWKTPAEITSWAPLELTLFSLQPQHSLNCRLYWPSGHFSEVFLDSKKKKGVLSGTDFVFANGESSLILGFPQNQIARPHFLPWIRRKKGSHYHLVVSPEGGYETRLSSDWNYMEEHFCFYLALPQEARLPFTVTRKQANELIPPYICSRMPC